MKNGLPSARSTMETYSASDERGRVERADEAAYVVVGERLDREALDPAQAHPLRDLATERVAAVEVVGAVGHDERDSPATDGRRGS